VQHAVIELACTQHLAWVGNGVRRPGRVSREVVDWYEELADPFPETLEQTVGLAEHEVVRLAGEIQAQSMHSVLLDSERVSKMVPLCCFCSYTHPTQHTHTLH
jgi:hypothetical protein